MQTLDLNEAARVLHIHPVTLLKKARSGEVPAAKPGKCWIFLAVDLEQYIRSQYVRQALQSDMKGVSECLSTSVGTRRTGGSKSLSVVESQYNEVLALPTAKRPKNMNRLLKRNSGSKKN